MQVADLYLCNYQYSNRQDTGTKSHNGIHYGAVCRSMSFAACAEVKFREEMGRRKPAGFVADAVFYQNPTTWLKGKN